MSDAINQKIAEMTDKANSMMAETRLQFDTLIEMQKDERIEMQKMFHEQLDKTRKHYGRIIISLVLTLVILIGGIVGTIGYILANFDIIGTTYQETYDSSVINDGIHLAGKD